MLHWLTTWFKRFFSHSVLSSFFRASLVSACRTSEQDRVCWTGSKSLRTHEYWKQAAGGSESIYSRCTVHYLLTFITSDHSLLQDCDWIWSLFIQIKLFVSDKYSNNFLKPWELLGSNLQPFWCPSDDQTRLSTSRSRRDTLPQITPKGRAVLPLNEKHNNSSLVRKAMCKSSLDYSCSARLQISCILI